MDLVRSDLLPPIIRDLHREAERRALVARAVRGWGRRELAGRLGAALTLAGCRLQAAGQRLASAAPFAAPAPCGCGALTVPWMALERR